jgi:excalibur calcium-binding domain-containing protein
MKKLLLVLIVGGVFLYYRAHRTEPPTDMDSFSEQAEEAEERSESERALPAVERDAQDFKCDGRIYCSQMTSCEEATFFLQNCPGVKMDGENGGRGDGIPCERQWCGSH